MSGSMENDIAIGGEPAEVGPVTPSGGDAEAAPPDTLPPDHSNRTLVDEEGPF